MPERPSVAKWIAAAACVAVPASSARPRATEGARWTMTHLTPTAIFAQAAFVNDRGEVVGTRQARNAPAQWFVWRNGKLAAPTHERPHRSCRRERKRTKEFVEIESLERCSLLYFEMHASLARLSVGASAYDPALATDTVGPVTISYSKPSGSLFPIGRTKVVVTATDASGNTSTASFWVVVVAPKPVIARPTTLPAFLVAGRRATVTFTVTRSDTGAKLTFGGIDGAVSVNAQPVAHHELFSRGVARVELTIPKAAKGKVLTVRVTIKVGDRTATRVATFRVG